MYLLIKSLNLGCVCVSLTIDRPIGIEMEKKFFVEKNFQRDKKLFSNICDINVFSWNLSIDL